MKQEWEAPARWREEKACGHRACSNPLGNVKMAEQEHQRPAGHYRRSVIILNYIPFALPKEERLLNKVSCQEGKCARGKKMKVREILTYLCS